VVAARYKAWDCGNSLAGIEGSNPTGGKWEFISCECCVLSGNGLCEVLISYAEGSYRLCV
jgi:hypothetical protein